MPALPIIPAALAVLCLACGAASAQSASGAGSSSTTPGTMAPATDLDAKPGTLSDKLGGTGGVIKPTGDVDPDMHKMAPQTGTMPVIKPRQVPRQSGDGATHSGTNLY